MAKALPKVVKNFINGYIDNLDSQIEIEKAILFGSYARGAWRRDIDIDLIIISPNFKKMKYMERLVWLSKMRGDKFINRAMDVLGYTADEFEKLRERSVVIDEAWREGVRIK